MPEPVTSLLEQRLDAWGRAELHTATKQLPGPGPAFTNAVAAEAKYRRMLNCAMLLALLVFVLTIAVVAYIKVNAPVSPVGDDVRQSQPEVRPLAPLSLIR